MSKLCPFYLFAPWPRADRPCLRPAKAHALLLFTLALLALVTLAPRPARAQQSNWAPCNPDGSLLTHSYAPDSSGFYLMVADMTGTGGGSQTLPATQTGGYFYGPNPNPYSFLSWLCPSGSYTYDDYTANSDDGDTYGIAAYALSVMSSGSAHMSQGQADVGYTWRASFRWRGAGPPPPYQDFLVQCGVGAGTFGSYIQDFVDDNPGPLTGLSASAWATDEFGDSNASSYNGGTFTPYPSNFGYSDYGQPGYGPYYHLKRVPVSGSGVGTVTRTGQAHTDSSNTVDGSQYRVYITSGAAVYGEAKPDNRGVTISCPQVDNITWPDNSTGSRYKDPSTGNVINNVRQPNGTMRGDTVLYSTFNNSGGESLDYTANPVGLWSLNSNALNSNVHWYESVAGQSLTGMYPTYLSGNNIDDFLVTEFYGPIMTNPQNADTDHIFISIYDANDNAEAASNYYMHFHDHYEPASWPDDTGYPQKVMGTDPEVPSFPNYPWILATDQNGNVVPPLIGLQGGNGVFTFSGAVTKGGHVDGALGVTKSDVSAQFGGGYDWSTSTDTGISVNPTPAILATQQTWAVERPCVQRDKGHLDIYGTNGYTGTGVWINDTQVTTDYSYYQPYQPTNVVPSNPAPGYNPPGYQ